MLSAACVDSGSVYAELEQKKEKEINSRPLKIVGRCEAAIHMMSAATTGYIIGILPVSCTKYARISIQSMRE